MMKNIKMSDVSKGYVNLVSCAKSVLLVARVTRQISHTADLADQV